MKRIIYLLIAVSIIGGVAYVLTQTGMLKGDFYDGQQTVILDLITDGDTENPDPSVTVPSIDSDADGLMDEDDTHFSDLSKSDYYTYAIIIGDETWVNDPDKGMIRVFEGYSNGTSGAKNTIARSEAMALALRFYLA